MKKIRGFKYRIYPTIDQEQFLAQQFSNCRFVYNYFLELRSKEYKENGRSLSGFDCVKMLPELKNKNPWLKATNSQSLQSSVLNLEKAFKSFFKKIAKYPRFKSRRNKQSVSILQHFRIKGDKVFVPKLKSGIKCVFHRPLPGSPKSLVISKSCSGKYFVLFTCEYDSQPLPGNTNEVGIDLGLTRFITCSNGEKIEHPHNLRRAERRLKRLQRRLSAKQRGSKNRAKSIIKLAIQHERVNNRRSDFLHKLSRRIVNENQVICLESLNVNGMLRNHRLAKSIADSGWSEFVEQLKYKAEAGGRIIRQIDQFYPSSKTCNVCGYVLSKLKLSVRNWVCPGCDTVHDRDENASKVILKIGRDTSEFKPVERRASALSILSMKQVASKKQESLASLK